MKQKTFTEMVASFFPRWRGRGSGSTVNALLKDEAMAAPAGLPEAASKDKSEKDADSLGPVFLCVVLDAIKYTGIKRYVAIRTHHSVLGMNKLF